MLSHKIIYSKVSILNQCITSPTTDQTLPRSSWREEGFIVALFVVHPGREGMEARASTAVRGLLLRTPLLHLIRGGTGLENTQEAEPGHQSSEPIILLPLWLTSGKVPTPKSSPAVEQCHLLGSKCSSMQPYG